MKKPKAHIGKIQSKKDGSKFYHSPEEKVEMYHEYSNVYLCGHMLSIFLKYYKYL